MLRCDFNKVSLQLFCSGASAWVFSCKSAAYFRNNFSSEHLWGAASIIYSKTNTPLHVKGSLYPAAIMLDQQTFTCLKSTIETLKKDFKCLLKLTIKTPEKCK